MDQLIALIKLHPGISALVVLGVLGFGFFMVMRAVSKLVWRVVIGLVLGGAAGAGMMYFVCPFFHLPTHWAGVVAVVFFAFGFLFKKIPGVG